MTNGHLAPDTWCWRDMPRKAETRPITPTCVFCGEPERVDLLEMWSSHEFMLECCCDGMHETVVREMADDPAWARTLLQQIGVEDITGYELRRLVDNGCCGMILDWKLELRAVPFATARTFIDRHHAHCDAPAAWRFGTSCWNGGTMIGVVTVGNPVARGLCKRGVLEVNRLCIRRDIPRALAWNAASKLYGWSAREAECRGWSHIVTYTRADEDGTSIQAAGWTMEATVRGRGWHSRRRNRSNRNGFIDKVRWGKALRARVIKPDRRPPPNIDTSANIDQVDRWLTIGGQSVDLPFGWR